MAKLFSLFSMMLLLVNLSLGNDKFESLLDDLDLFLAKNVGNDLVNYSNLKNNNSFNLLVEQIENFNHSDLKEKEKIAFYINAYNIMVLKGVMDHYPIASTNDINGFFTKTKHLIGREAMTLNSLEHEVLFKHYHDLRYHFVLVCGAKGCPPLIPEAYRPEKLDQQLDQQTSKAANSDSFTKVNTDKKSVALSQIFKWYVDDFNSKKDIFNFLNKHRPQPIPESYKITYYPYDWSLNSQNAVTPGQGKPSTTSNLQSFTPSVLLKKGQKEWKLFNNLYTQTRYFDNFKITDINGRANFFSGIFQFNFGLTKKLNGGVSFMMRSTSNRGPNSSPLDVFRFQNNANARTAITNVGLIAKYAPIPVEGLSLQTMVFFPTGKKLEGAPEESLPYIDFDAIQWFQQAFYDVRLAQRFNLFAELDFLIRIDVQNKDRQSSQVAIPLKVFPSYFITNKLTAYAMTEFAPTLGAGIFSSAYVQSGLGLKYQLTNQLEIEGLYTNFWWGKNSGAGVTYNLGLRYLH